MRYCCDLYPLGMVFLPAGALPDGVHFRVLADLDVGGGESVHIRVLKQAVQAGVREGGEVAR